MSEIKSATTHYQKKGGGFTLIELLVAITVMAIISAIGLTTYSYAKIVARDGKRKDDLRQIQTGLELFYQSQNPKYYPQTTQINSSSANWTTLLSAVYINQMPLPPTSATGYEYYYTPSNPCGPGSCNYDLCAKLENINDPITPSVSIGVIAGGGVCGGVASDRYFHLANP